MSFSPAAPLTMSDLAQATAVTPGTVVWNPVTTPGGQFTHLYRAATNIQYGTPEWHLLGERFRLHCLIDHLPEAQVSDLLQTVCNYLNASAAGRQLTAQYTHAPCIPLSSPAAVPLPGAAEAAEDTSDYELILSRVQGLQTDEEDRPSQYAVNTTIELLRSARVRMPSAFPRAWVMSDEGGIRLEWNKGSKSARLVVPAGPGGRMYLYHEFGADYGLDELSDPSGLARRLTEMAS